MAARLSCPFRATSHADIATERPLVKTARLCLRVLPSASHAKNATDLDHSPVNA